MKRNRIWTKASSALVSTLPGYRPSARPGRRALATSLNLLIAAVVALSLLPLAVGAGSLDTSLAPAAPGSIGDLVWYDMNSDGVQDFGEPGLGGVQVILNGSGPTQYATTQSDGSYVFSDLPSDSYTVSINAATVPAGYVLSTSNLPLPVNLGDGEDYLAADFGYDGTGSIGDTVWADLDGSGIQEVGEAGIPDILVSLIEDVDDKGVIDPSDILVDTTDTSALGKYTFAGVPPADYLVLVDKADPEMPLYTNTTPNPHAVSLLPHQNYLNAGFGFGPYTQLGDSVWFDANADGIQGAGEGGIPGVQMILTGSGGSQFAVTDANGYYLFDLLEPGSYNISVNPATLPPGYVQSGDPDEPGGPCTTCDGQHAADLSVGDHYLTADFGYAGSGCIGDRVWDDQDGDGDQDALEPGVPGVMVHLYEDVDGNGIPEAGDPLRDAMPTDVLGLYQFCSLPDGAYIVLVELSDPALPPNYGPTTFQPVPVTLSPGENHQDADLGFGAFGAIGDAVYFDANGDGVYDSASPDEYGVPGVTVEIWEDTDCDSNEDVGPLAVAMTDAYGLYFFGGLPASGTPAPCYVAVMLDPGTIPPEFTPTTLNPFPVANLGAGQFEDGADFGLRGQLRIGDYIFNDVNGNGTHNCAFPEDGIPAITVWLYEDTNANGTLETGPEGDNMVGTTESSTGPGGTCVHATSGGFYGFDNLVAGTYFVLADEADPQFPSGQSSTTGNPVKVELTEAVSPYRRADVGFRTAATIGDFVWDDVNRNGRQDPGEPGLSGIQVDLYAHACPPGSSPDETAVTDPLGFYSFPDMTAGDYCVDIPTPPPGYWPTLPNQGSPDGDSENAPVDVAAVDGPNNDIDFGFYEVLTRLAVTKSLTDPIAGSALVSETVTFTIRIENQGETYIPNWTATDNWDESCMVMTSSWPPANQPWVSPVTWPPLPGLAPGDVATLSIDFHASAPSMRCLNGVTVTGVDELQRDFGPLEANDYVHIKEADLGDAPEIGVAYPAFGTPGAFPTCRTAGPAGSFVQHGLGWAHFDWVGAPQAPWDPEGDGDAGLCPNCFPTYDDDECYADGDAGLMFPEPYTIVGPAGQESVAPCDVRYPGTPLGQPCYLAQWGTDVDIFIVNNMPVDGFVNVLMDWDQSGHWAGAETCPTGPAPEHVLVDFPVPQGFVGPLSALAPPGFLIGPNTGHVWTRFSITEQPVGPDWDGAGIFEDGESEDYLLEIAPPTPGLRVTKTLVDPAGGEATVGDTVIFTIRIENTGPSTIATWTLTDRYDDACMTMTSADVVPTEPAGPDWTPSPVFWRDMPAIDPGEAMTITVDFHADAPALACTNAVVLRGVDEFGQPVGPSRSNDDVAIRAGSIGDLVWWDVNYDGQQDAGEPGIEGVIVLLHLDTVASQTTDVDGLYSHGDLEAGEYRVEVAGSNFDTGMVLEEWYTTLHHVGPPETDSDANPVTRDAYLTLGDVEVNNTIDFGFDIAATYEITKVLNTPGPIVLGQLISFTIEIENTGDAYIGALPLEDTYDNAYLTFAFSDPLPDDMNNDGTLNWSDLVAAPPNGFGTDLAPGATFEVVLYFVAREDTYGLEPDARTYNTAIVDGALADPDGEQGPLAPLKPLPRGEADAGVRIERPTADVIGSFAAVAQGSGALVEWESETEIDILGYNILRWRVDHSNNAGFVTVNPTLIPAERTGTDDGWVYPPYLDQGLENGIWGYTLEIVDLDGSRLKYGAEVVTVEGQFLRYLPLVVR